MPCRLKVAVEGGTKKVKNCENGTCYNTQCFRKLNVIQFGFTSTLNFSRCMALPRFLNNTVALVEANPKKHAKLVNAKSILRRELTLDITVASDIFLS